MLSFDDWFEGLEASTKPRVLEGRLRTAAERGDEATVQKLLDDGVVNVEAKHKVRGGVWVEDGEESGSVVVV